MPGIMPEVTAGGVVIRDADGNPTNPVNVQNALSPPAGFVSTCELTALPSDCTARIEPKQINAIVSEIMNLAATFDPNGPWTCNAVINLGNAYNVAQAAYERVANKGQPNGYAPLDATARIPAMYLPGFVDDVLEFANFAAFPNPGQAGVLYVALDTSKVYRWSGTMYIEVSASEVNSVNGHTGIVVLNKGDVGLGNVDNTSDANKPVSTAQATALALKADLNSPTFTGDPKAPTPAAADNDTSIATTAWVRGYAVGADSPVFTGNPTAPTPANGDNDTSIATTAFVKNVMAALGFAPGRNYLHNGTFLINQRGMAGTPVNDDNYCLDRWIMLSQSGAVNVNIQVPAEAGYQAIMIGQTTVSQRFGFAQIMESWEVRAIRGGPVALGQIRIQSSVAVNLKYAVVYSGLSTDATVISDIVNNWASTNYVANDFFINNYAPIVIGTQAMTAGVWATLPDITATLPAGAVNVIVFFWTETAVAASAFLQVQYAKLEKGTFTTAPVFDPVDVQLSTCQRFWESSYVLNTAPGTILGGSSGIKAVPGCAVSTPAAFQPTWHIQFKVPKRTVPTVAIYNPATGAMGSARDDTNANTLASTIGITNGWASAYCDVSAGSNYYIMWAAGADL